MKIPKEFIKEYVKSEKFINTALSRILCKLQNGNIICFAEAEIDLLNFCLKYTVA